MTKQYLIMLLTAVALTACGKQEAPSAPPAPAADPFEMSAEERIRGKRFEPLSNDDIISETKKCESAGLDAVSFVMEKRYGSGTIVAIQCKPKEQCK